MQFTQWPLWLNAVLFLAAAVAVWGVGFRLERVVDVLGTRTGLGQAMAGLVLLAAATSLPEIATTLTATLNGNPSLAVHNLFGTVPANLLILVLVDVLIARPALTAFAPRFDLLTEGLGVVVLLSLGAMALVVEGSGGPVVLGRTLNVPLLLIPLAYVSLMVLINRSRRHPRWSPRDIPESDDGDGRRPGMQGRPTRRVWVSFGVLAALVLASGWLLARVADALAQQSGLGSGLVGVVLLGIATSLPEISTTTSAALHGNSTLAISNVFGSSLFDVALLFLVGVLASGPITGGRSTGVVFIAVLGVTMTTVYLWGLLEHRDRTYLRMGVDSIIVLVLYVAGIAALYGIEQRSPDAGRAGGQQSSAPVATSADWPGRLR